MSKEEAKPPDQDEKQKKKEETDPKSHEENESDTKPAKKNVDDTERNQEKDLANTMPKSIFFLLGNEFCERFSFYGMRTILTLYLVQQLDLSESVATKIYHGFEVLCYSTPLLGAILADSWLGKFRTIFYLSILYAIGNVTISVGAVPAAIYKMKVVSYIGIVIIGVGTGGIKPCVSAFGGDQFLPCQEGIRKYFFSMFYFVINLGSFLSTALTPVLRGDIKCFGQDTCYSLAFFIPAILFVIALILFVVGKPLYILKPVEGSVFVSVFKCIGYALYRKVTAKKEKKEHWIEYADDKFDKDLIYDVKCLLSVLFMCIPLPVFWALFEQQGSKWVLQATKMNGEVFGYHIKPDHMQLVNPLFILILIPVFDYIIYPLFSKCKMCRTSLQRMTVGGLLCALSFVIAAFIQLDIETELPTVPSGGYTDLTIINNSPCQLDIKSNFDISLKQFGYASARAKLLHRSNKWRFTPKGCSANTTAVHELSATSLFETMMVTLENNNLRFDVSNDSRIKDKDGNSRVRVVFATDYQFTESENASFLLQGEAEFYIYPKNMTRPGRIGMTDYYSIKPKRYKLFLPSNGTKSHEDKPFAEISAKPGGSYIIYIYQNTSGNQKVFRFVETVKPNSVHILWQIPQGIIITAGEVMFSITGIEFSYSQSPSSLKSVVQAVWMLTSAIGNLLVVVLVQNITFEKQSHEFFMYAAIMAFSMIVLGIMAYFYKYKKEKDSLD